MQRAHRGFVIKAGVLAVCVFVTWRFVAWRRAESTFKKPTADQLQRAFPGDSLKLFESSSTLTLYSIKPNPLLGDFAASGAQKQNSILGIHGHYVIVGSVTLRDEAEKVRLRSAVYDANAWPFDHPNALSAQCFNPRHAIRATGTGKSIDVLLCFDCGNGYVHKTGVGDPLSSFEIGSARDERVLNGFLSAHGVPVVP